MKMITVNVDETVYRRIQNVASRTDRSASELIREAMAEYAAGKAPQEVSIFDDHPARVGVIHQLPADEVDLLDEMLS